MRHGQAFLSAIAIALLLLPRHTSGNNTFSSGLRILHPLDHSVLGGAGLSHIVVETNGAGKVMLRHNGKVVGNPKVKENIYHYTIQLEFGLNKIETEAMRNGKVVETDRRELFFFSYIAKDNEIPKGFASKPFHQKAAGESRCARCHVLKPKKTDLLPPTPSDSSCYVCHKDLTGFRQVHGPVSVWGCLQCHDPNAAPALYTTPVPVRDLCYGCHEDQKRYFFSTMYQHGPTATGMCTICHNPHASDNEFWLKKEPWDLCTTCHVEKASGRHVIAWGPSGNTHPTRGRPDPMKPEREFSCRSCHNPHASNAPKLWNFNVTSYFQLCQTCHNK